MMLELVVWLDTCVGLLHRSTEYLCEHRYTTHIAGYLSRTDYVAHVQLETMAIHIATRFTSANRSMSSLMLHLSLLANHLLNVCCSLGDLGCISFILWGFEDRENIFMLLEHLLGARIHTSFDSPVSSVPVVSVNTVDTLVSIAVTRLDYMLDVILLRHNIARVYGVASVDAMLSIGSIFSGPMLFSSGVASDTRSECTCYSRSSISILLSGTMSCSYVRILIRLDIGLNKEVVELSVLVIEYCAGFAC
jgi:NADH:ubiquinone oxidoreductase subunit D